MHDPLWPATDRMHVQATLTIDASNGGLGAMSDAATDHIPQVNVVRCVLVVVVLVATLVSRALAHHVPPHVGHQPHRTREGAPRIVNEWSSVWASLVSPDVRPTAPYVRPRHVRRNNVADPTSSVYFISPFFCGPSHRRSNWTRPATTSTLQAARARCVAGLGPKHAVFGTQYQNKTDDQTPADYVLAPPLFHFGLDVVGLSWIEDRLGWIAMASGVRC